MSVLNVQDEEDYQSHLTKAGSKLVVVDFSAEWCGPCKMIAPFVESLSKKYKSTAVFLKVDVDSCQEVAASCNIKAMPTFVFYKNKAEIHRVQGADPNALESKVKELADSVCTFSGSGQRLGGIVENLGTESAEGSAIIAGLTSWLPSVPNVLTGLITGSGSSSTSENLQNSNQQAEDEAAAQKAMAVNDSSPVATIQIRLNDGAKLTLKINTDQLVSRIREFICIARPALSSRPFSLMSTFPSKEITNEDATILESKLANSVIVVKLN